MVDSVLPPTDLSGPARLSLRTAAAGIVCVPHPAATSPALSPLLGASVPAFDDGNLSMSTLQGSSG